MSSGRAKQLRKVGSAEKWAATIVDIVYVDAEAKEVDWAGLNRLKFGVLEHHSGEKLCKHPRLAVNEGVLNVFDLE
jgi:hypothetical protein